MADEKRTAPAGKTWLTLHWWQGGHDELAVVHTVHGTSIPFVWVDHETLEIDDVFADSAAVQRIIKPSRNETGT